MSHFGWKFYLVWQQSWVKSIAHFSLPDTKFDTCDSVEMKLNNDVGKNYQVYNYNICLFNHLWLTNHSCPKIRRKILENMFVFSLCLGASLERVYNVTVGECFYFASGANNCVSVMNNCKCYQNCVSTQKPANLLKITMTYWTQTQTRTLWAVYLLEKKIWLKRKNWELSRLHENRILSEMRCQIVRTSNILWPIFISI